MKAFLIRAPGKASVVEVPKPRPRDGEVLVQLKCCGVCGTDIEKVHGAGITSSILGHEAVGEVSQVGRGVKGVEVGERVFTHHHVPCYDCATCTRGAFTYCPSFGKSNLVPCGLAEYYVVPRFNVERGAIISLPDDLGYEEASFIEPLACCIMGLGEAKAYGTRSAVIYGAGPVGLLHLKLLRAYGVKKIAIADIAGYRLEFARKLGADVCFNPMEEGSNQGRLESFQDGPELAIVATGSSSALTDALAAVARGGRVLLFGAPRRGTVASLDVDRFFLRGAHLITSYSASERETAEATRMLHERVVSVTDLITHRFPLKRSGEAFAVASTQQCAKALITN